MTSEQPVTNVDGSVVDPVCTQEAKARTGFEGFSIDAKVFVPGVPVEVPVHDWSAPHIAPMSVPQFAHKGMIGGMSPMVPHHQYPQQPWKQRQAAECYNCGQLGHMSKTCPNPKPADKKKKMNGGRVGNVQGGRPRVQKDAKSDKDAKPNEPIGLSSQANAFVPGSQWKSLKEPSTKKSATCFTCNSVGHISRDCPQKGQSVAVSEQRTMNLDSFVEVPKKKDTSGDSTPSFVSPRPEVEVSETSSELNQQRKDDAAMAEKTSEAQAKEEKAEEKSVEQVAETPEEPTGKPVMSWANVVAAKPKASIKVAPKVPAKSKTPAPQVEKVVEVVVADSESKQVTKKELPLVTVAEPLVQKADPEIVQKEEQEPAAQEPATESTVQEPVAEKPSTQETVDPAPLAQESVAPEHAASEPVAQEPAALEPVAQEPTATQEVENSLAKEVDEEQKENLEKTNEAKIEKAPVEKEVAATTNSWAARARLVASTKTPAAPKPRAVKPKSAAQEPQISKPEASEEAPKLVVVQAEDVEVLPVDAPVQSSDSIESAAVAEPAMETMPADQTQESTEVSVTKELEVDEKPAAETVEVAEEPLVEETDVVNVKEEEPIKEAPVSWAAKAAQPSKPVKMITKPTPSKSAPKTTPKPVVKEEPKPKEMPRSKDRRKEAVKPRDNRASKAAKPEVDAEGWSTSTTRQPTRRREEEKAESVAEKPKQKPTESAPEPVLLPVAIKSVEVTEEAFPSLSPKKRQGGTPAAKEAAAPATSWAAMLRVSVDNPRKAMPKAKAVTRPQNVHPQSATKLSSAQPEVSVTKTDVSEAEIVESETVEAEVVKSEMAEIVSSEIVKPEIVEPEVAASEAVKPEVVESEIKTEVADVEVVESEVVEPEAVEPQVVQQPSTPVVAEPAVAEPEDKSVVAEPETEEPKVSDPEINEAEVQGAKAWPSLSSVEKTEKTEEKVVWGPRAKKPESAKTPEAPKAPDTTAKAPGRLSKLSMKIVPSYQRQSIKVVEPKEEEEASDGEEYYPMSNEGRSYTIMHIMECYMALRESGFLPERQPALGPRAENNRLKRKNTKKEEKMDESWREEVTPIVVNEESWAAKQVELKKASPAEVEEQLVTRKIKSNLNKLTLEKYDKLYQQLLELDISTSTLMSALVNEIFEKATTQHHFISMYVDLCNDLERDLKCNEDVGSFKKVLLTACQENFSKYMQPPVELDGLEGEEHYEALVKYKTKMLGNVRLVGELLLKNMIPAKLISILINNLLEGEPSEHKIESLIAFLTVIGPVFDVSVEGKKSSKNTKMYLTGAFNQLDSLKNNPKISNRVSCLIMDLIDMRASEWKNTEKRQRPEGPTRISEVPQNVNKVEVDTEGVEWNVVGSNKAQRSRNSKPEPSQHSAPSSYGAKSLTQIKKRKDVKKSFRDSVDDCARPTQEPKVTETVSECRPTGSLMSKIHETFTSASPKPQTKPIYEGLDHWIDQFKTVTREVATNIVSKEEGIETLKALGEVPVEDQVAIVRVLLTVLDWKTSERKAACDLVSVALTGFSSEKVEATIDEFLEEDFDNMKIDLPLLPKIMKEEFFPAIASAVSKEKLSEWTETVA